jgi:hypothetical protein
VVRCEFRKFGFEHTGFAHASPCGLIRELLIGARLELLLNFIAQVTFQFIKHLGGLQSLGRHLASPILNRPFKIKHGLSRL